MASLFPETVFEGIEFSEANTVLLMSLMEETQEDDHDQYNGDDRLVSMIQSLEAEIRSDPLLGHNRYEIGQVDGQDCSTSVSDDDDYNWVDMELISSSSVPFDHEMMDAWSPCALGNESNYSEFYYEVLLEQQLRETYLPQEPSDAVF